jgi:hypothetical protein
MKTQTFIKDRKLPFLLALGCAALTGCMSDSGNNADETLAARIQGQIQGDIEVSGSGSTSGWEGTVVTAHSINQDGSLGAAQDSTTARASGSFVLETSARGSQEWILRARRGSEEWMTRFQGNLEADKTEDARPLTLESTLEAAVLLELEKTAEGREVHSSEVNLALDAKAAASARNAYRGAESARNVLVANLAASVKAASRARRTFLESADSLYEQHRSQIESARVQAEVAFNASLYAANGDTGAVRNAERAFVSAMVDAYLKADVKRTEYARSSEAAYHAFVRASLLVTDSARTATARNYARVLAIASDTAMRNEFREAASSQTRLQLVTEAGARFRASVDTAGTRARLDSAVSRFRSEVRTAFNNTSDTGFTVFANVISQLTVTSLLDSLSASIMTDIGVSTEGNSVGEAYADAHLAARAQLLTRFKAANNDEAKAKAAANVMAFVSVRSANMN